MTTITLTNKEWYFLHIQMENIIKQNPDNHIAKNILEELILNRPLLSEITNEVKFKQEYECKWVDK